MTLKDAESLMAEFERLLIQMEQTEDDASIPALADFPSLARLDSKNDYFWDPRVTWVSDSGKIRCRPVENDNYDVSIVINSPRTAEQKTYENYFGPILFIPRGGARFIMGKIRENLQRYYNNTD